MMLSFLRNSGNKNKTICLICSENLTDLNSYPDTCKDLFHYKCLRNYVDKRIDDKQPVICPESSCNKFFARIANKYKNSDEIIFQNVILPIDEITCCICFSKFKSPVASSDSCSHTFCCECIHKWCTFKHECPMDRKPIKLLLLSDFPGGHIISIVDPPAIEQDLNGDGDNDDSIDTICEVCDSGHNEHQLLLCDNCNRGYHIYCLTEPLSTIPDGDWFCEECRSHDTVLQDTSVVIGRRMPRGLGRVISNLQSSLTSRTESSNRQRIRNNTISRARSISNRIRRNDDIFESDDDVHYNITQSDNVSPIRRGLRVRISEPSRPVVTAVNRINRIRLIRGDESNITTSSGTTCQSLNVSVESRITEEDVPTTNARSGGSRRATTRTHGSLISDIKSEPLRKKVKLDDSSTSYQDEDNVSQSGSETRPIKRELITRYSKTLASVRSQLQSTSQGPRKVTDDSSDDEDDYIPKMSCVRKRHSIIESDSNDDDEHQQKSPKPTIPFDIDESFESLCSSDRFKAKPKKIANKSRLRRPSKSKKKKVSKINPITKKAHKRVKIHKRRSTKPRNRKKLTVEKLEKARLEYAISPRKLSIVGRENQLPCIGDDENYVREKSPIIASSVIRAVYPSGSILSEISARQNNLRNMTLATINRLPDGTVIHKRNITAPSIVSNITPMLDKIPTLSKPLQIVNQTKPPLISTKHTVHFTLPLSGDESPSMLDVPSTSQSSTEHGSSKSEPIAVQFNVKIKPEVSKELLKIYSKNQINKEDYKYLEQKILDKIMKKKGSNCDERNVKAFVRKYVKYYLVQKKRVPV